MPLATPAPNHLPALARLIALDFGGSADDGLAWLKNIPPSDLRFIADADAPHAPVATLELVPMGQYFGGRPVPMTDIASVARFSAMGVRHIRLETARANAPARSLFAQLGFSETTIEMMRDGEDGMKVER